MVVKKTMLEISVQLTCYPMFSLCSHGSGDNIGRLCGGVADSRSLRLGAARRYEKGEGMRLWSRARSCHAHLDSGSGLSARNAGEPLEVPALRIAEGAVSVHRPADDAASAGLRPSRLGNYYFGTGASR